MNGAWEPQKTCINLKSEAAFMRRSAIALLLHRRAEQRHGDLDFFQRIPDTPP